MGLSAAARVGMLTVLAVIVFGIVFVQVGHVGPETGDCYHVIFDDVQGLQVRGAVQLSGVRIGYVSDLQLNAQNRVDVSIRVTRPDVKLFSSEYFTYTIASSLLGDKWVEIHPGTIPEDVKPVAPGDRVIGTNPVSLDDLAKEGSELMQEMQGSIAALNDIIGDDSFKTDIRATMTNLRDISGNLKGASRDAKTLVHTLNGRVVSLADSLDRVVGHVDDTVVILQADAQAVGQSLRQTAGNVNKIIASNSGNINTIVANLRQMSSSLKNTASAVEALATDETLKDDVMTVAANIRKTSEEIAGIAADIRSITGDPQVQEDIKETVHNAREATESVKRITNKAEGIVDSVSGGISGIKKNKIFEGEVSHEWNVSNGQAHANINAYLFPYGGPFTMKVGVDSIGHDNLVNFQGGKAWDNFRLRGGVIRSQFGIGADAWLFDKRLETSIEAYDTRDVKVDVLGKVRLPGDFYIYGGVRDVTDKHNSYPTVGAGVRF